MRNRNNSRSFPSLDFQVLGRQRLLGTCITSMEGNSRAGHFYLFRGIRIWGGFSRACSLKLRRHGPIPLLMFRDLLTVSSNIWKAKGILYCLTKQTISRLRCQFKCKSYISYVQGVHPFLRKDRTQSCLDYVFTSPSTHALAWASILRDILIKIYLY